MPLMRSGRHGAREPDAVRVVVGDGQDLVGGESFDPLYEDAGEARVVGASRGAVACIATRSSSSTSTMMYTGDWHSTTRSRSSGCPWYCGGTAGSSLENSSEQLQPLGLGQLQEVVADLGQRRGRVVSLIPSILRARRGAPAASEERPAPLPLTIGTRTALPHSVHEPS